jgi:hypothetical protein
MAGEHPYPTAGLLRWLAEGKKRRSGGATGGRSSAMAGGGGARCARFFGWKAAAAAWGARARRLNRAVHGALACGPGAPRGEK